MAISVKRGWGTVQYFAVPGRDPAFHQAFEQVTFEQVRDEDVLLLWINDPAIVCGAFQTIYQEASVYRAARQGIAVIRRDSGGGTVYHDPGNLNYTIIRDGGGGVDYDGFLEDILTALHRVGIPVRKSKVCDLTLEGKKISGSAQRVSRGRVLHHGTLLFDADLRALRAVADRTGRVYESRAVKSVPAQVTNLKPYFGGGIEAFRDALAAAFPADLRPAGLRAEQLQSVEQLAEEKYRTWLWNCGRSPAFTCRAEGQVGDAPVSVAYAAKKGVICDCRITSPVLGDLSGAFLDAALRPDLILRLCRELTDRPETLADLIL
ncbi:MAG: biotin/lipoate A/B protein ligase family protein [Oscillospiraceae bacterium]|nr:biotin/lipoate A/B protein ligase family protein [Oscillospiraceae bacterium]